MRSKSKEDRSPIGMDQNIIETPMEEVMHDSMIPYAEHVIMERAVPRVEDGLKPVQRRILFTMKELAITPDTPYRKCARIVGDCLGKYHPHGDSSVYEALVRMAQDFSMREKLVDGHGNFGSVDGDGAAAMRYTEARMTPMAMEMLKDIDKNTVSFRLNFDDTLKEPNMLPASFPNLLVNGASGIAVGLATNIPTHNLKEIIQAAVAQIENPEISTEELMKLVPGPDFPTGGILLDTPEIRSAYETGRGKLTLRARTHIEEGPSGRKLIVITEIPYQVNKAAMLEKILKLSEEKKTALGCIYDIRDESDRTGMRAVIELRKDADVDRVLAYLFKYSDMQITFGVNMVAIADGKPRLLSLKSALRYYIRHRKNVITARTQYDLEKAKARAHILEGLMIAVDNLDEVIRIIRASETPKSAKASLMTRFELSELQAQAILDMRLQRLTNLEIVTLRKEYAELIKEIAKLEAILASEKKLLNVIKKELLQLAEQYGSERLTEIVPSSEVVEAVQKEEIIPEDALVTYSRSGCLKRVYPNKGKKQTDIEEEPTLYTFDTHTDHTLFFFTNLGNCYTLSVASLPESKPKDRGALLSGVLAGLESNEQPVAIFCLKPSVMSSLPCFLFMTKNGMTKRSLAEEYNVRRGKFAAINLKENDRLLQVQFVSEQKDLLVFTHCGMCIRFHANDIPVQGRAAGGVKGITLDDNDEVFWCGQPEPTNQLWLITEKGYAKRILYTDFESQARSGKGVKSFYFNKSGTNGSYLAAVLLLPQEGGVIAVAQAKTGVSTILSEDTPIRSKTDKGLPVIMAFLDDWIIGAELLAKPEN